MSVSVDVLVIPCLILSEDIGKMTEVSIFSKPNSQEKQKSGVSVEIFSCKVVMLLKEVA